MNEFEETQKIIGLKRYEKPPEGYLDDFVEEFHKRQRVELMKRSSRSLFFERLGTYLPDFGKQRWLVAGGAACAVLFVAVKFESGTTPAGGANVAKEVDAPQGQLTPVSTSPLFNPEIDLLEDFVVPVNEDEGHSPLFIVEPFEQRVGAEPEIIEL